jgi:hypothetical protein
MGLLTPEENRFLDVFLREATSPPFTGPATKALHKNGHEYIDNSYTSRGLMSRRSPGPASWWGTSPTSRRRSLGQTDRRRFDETRKSKEFASSDAEKAKSSLTRINRSEKLTS